MQRSLLPLAVASLMASPARAQVLINEVDANTGSPLNELVELYDGGVGLTPLDGMSIVFFRGFDDRSYAAFDLTGFATNGNGYFLLSNGPGIQPEIFLMPDALVDVNGAVALYTSPATTFPPGTDVTSANLMDAIVYGSGTTFDPELVGTLLIDSTQPQLDEGLYGQPTVHSNQRCQSGGGAARTTRGWLTSPTSPGQGPLYLGTNYCVQVPNSTGLIASMRAIGSRSIINNDVRLICCDMPQDQPGYFLVNSTASFVPIAVSNGNLCLAVDPGLGRYGSMGNLQNSGTIGSISFVIDLTSIPFASGTPPVVEPGDTFYFTAWFRDIAAGGADNNFANGLAITFQ
ncbi:MAG: hypothetical protein GY711_25895 [bacterium]|nr:hypothetical protein [bacterium]